MRTITVILEWADTDALMIRHQIEKQFPCLTMVNDIDEDTYEFTVIGRQEDIPAIERLLASVV